MSLTEIIDTSMEETVDIVDELLVSTVTEDTISELPVQKKQPAKRKNIAAPKPARAKSVAKPSAKPAGTKRKAAVEIYQDEEQDETEMGEIEPPKPRARAKKVARPKVVEEASDIQETEPPKKSKSATTAKSRTTTRVPAKSKAKQVIEHDGFAEDDIVPSPVNIRSNFLQSKSSKAAPKPVAAKAKPATKRAPKAAMRPVEEVVSEQESEAGQIQEEAPPRKRQRTASISRQEPAYRRRAGSVSDTERGDPMLRRKLGDITRKCENVELKYRSLKDVGVIEANNNVEKLRKQCEAITEKSDKLVASLRKELAQQASLLQESRKPSKEAQAQEKEAAKLRASNTEMAATLSAAQNEVKALQAKLAAARATPAPEPVKQPQTTTKLPVPARVAQNQTQNDRETQLKLALYADLTDLLIQNVKQTEEGDEYDCIQTGRNGCKLPFQSSWTLLTCLALHFKLVVDAENVAKARSSPNSTELEFLYRPQIHSDRDKELISIMPDYLTEELTFERGVASKFYARVVKTLTEKVVFEDDGEEAEE